MLYADLVWSSLGLASIVSVLFSRMERKILSFTGWGSYFCDTEQKLKVSSGVEAAARAWVASQRASTVEESRCSLRRIELAIIRHGRRTLQVRKKTSGGILCRTFNKRNLMPAHFDDVYICGCKDTKLKTFSKRWKGKEVLWKRFDVVVPDVSIHDTTLIDTSYRRYRTYCTYEPTAPWTDWHILT